MKKQGFTLIEVLAVIVVLAVIALITTPIIINVIDKAKKGALEDSAYGLLESANIYYAGGILDETNGKTEFTFKDGMQTSENKLSYKGKVENGSVRLYSDGKTALCITRGEYAALKNVNDKKVSVTRGRCSYNTETEEYETRGLCQDLQDDLDTLKKKHQQEIDALEKKYKEQMNQFMKDHADQIKTLEENYKDQIEALNQKITELESQQQIELEQLRKDYEAQIKTLTEAYEVQIKELNNQLNIFKNGGTAIANQILSGKTAFVKGQLITGTIVSKGATTYTPGTSNQTIASGQYLSGIQTIKGDSSLQAGNIKKGVSIFGIAGTFTSDANANASGILAGQTAYVSGNKITGTMPNRGAINATIGAGQSYTIPAGYHNGSGRVTANAISVSHASQSFFYDDLTDGSNTNAGINSKTVGVTNGRWVIIMVNLRHRSYDSDEVTMWIESGMTVYSSSTNSGYSKWNNTFGQSYMFFGYTTSSNVVIRSNKSYRWAGSVNYINIS